MNIRIASENQNRDILFISIFFITALLIFHPLFYTDYAYTDEIVQLWKYNTEDNFQMFLGQGRFITEKMFQWLFGRADTISDVKYIRIVSLTGWIISIPAWYFTLKRIVVIEQLPPSLAFFSTLYLICSPQFSIYVSWASCLELFLANTSGLVSGYLIYLAISCKELSSASRGFLIFGGVFAGTISLFTYQNGFGCFLLPFVLQLLSRTHLSRKLLLGIIAYLVIYVLYYFLFKLSLSMNGIAPSERTAMHFDLFPKVRLVLFRALNSSFHFTVLFNEKSIAGLLVYGTICIAWIVSTFLQKAGFSLFTKLKFFAVIFLIFGLAYIPGLVVRENYASNRTLLAMNMIVFALVYTSFSTWIYSGNSRRIAGALLGVFLVITSWYNFNKQFLSPVKKEYALLRESIEKQYHKDMHTVYFIQPHEDYFVRKYGITRSWDEFGVPSSFFSWVPEYFVKQVVFEKTGDRLLAEKIKVMQWQDIKAFRKANLSTDSTALLIDVEKLMD